MRTDWWGRTATVAWAVAIAVVAFAAARWPHVHNIYPTYAVAGGNWLAGADCYHYYFEAGDARVDLFRYSPLFAAFMAPWSVLPLGLGGALWRLLLGASLLVPAAWWVRRGPAAPLAPGRRGLLFLFLLPLALESFQNGQVNPPVAGLLLAAVTAVELESWWVAAACVVLATCLKGYPLAVGLLILAAHPRRF